MAQNTKEWRRDFIANDYKAPNSHGLPPNVTQDLLVSIPERQNLFNPYKNSDNNSLLCNNYQTAVGFMLTLALNVCLLEKFNW